MACHAGLAGYLQFAGAMLALIVAIALPTVLERRKARAHDKRVVASLAAIVANAFEVLDEAFQSSKDAEAAIHYIDQYKTDRWQSAIDALESVPLMELPDAALVQATIALRASMIESFGQLKHSFKLMLTPPPGQRSDVLWKLGLQMLDARHAVAKAAADRIAVFAKKSNP